MCVYKFIFSLKKTNHIRETKSANRKNISGPNVCQNSSCNLKEKNHYILYICNLCSTI